LASFILLSFLPALRVSSLVSRKPPCITHPGCLTLAPPEGQGAVRWYKCTTRQQIASGQKPIRKTESVRLALSFAGCQRDLGHPAERSGSLTHATCKYDPEMRQHNDCRSGSYWRTVWVIDPRDIQI
jgi:hypothetical protein